MGKSQRSLGWPLAEILERTAGNAFLVRPFDVLVCLSPFTLPFPSHKVSPQELGVAGLCSLHCQSICPSPFSFSTSSARDVVAVACHPPNLVGGSVALGQKANLGLFSSFFLCPQTCLFLSDCWPVSLIRLVGSRKYSISSQCTSFSLSTLPFLMAVSGYWTDSQTPLDPALSEILFTHYREYRGASW